MTSAAPDEGRGSASTQDGAGSDQKDLLAQRLAAAARELQDQSGPQQVLAATVRWALEVVPGAEEASLSIVVGRRRVEAQAASSDLPRIVDALQEEVGEGPCMSSAYDHVTVRVPDMASETRWPRFSERAAAMGAASMLSLQLYVEGDDLGALNLYARTAGAFDDRSEHVGLLFAAHAAVAYAGVQRETGLQRAMSSRQVIGQAQGVLMERERLTAEQAFERLVQRSQARNVKLHDVAEQLVTTGELA